MKIASILNSTPALSRVHEKPDTGSGSDQGKKRDQRDEQKRDSEFKRFGAELERVEQAVEAFGADAQTRAAGLQATREGNGPGMRVVLRDGTGAVVRQFTGEEFLRLREAATTDGRVRGKILDQKL